MSTPTAAREVVVRATASPGQEQQVISRDPIPDGFTLDDVELSAADLGCPPGALYLVQFVDEEDNVLRSVEVAAR